MLKPKVIYKMYKAFRISTVKVVCNGWRKWPFWSIQCYKKI